MRYLVSGDTSSDYQQIFHFLQKNNTLWSWEYLPATGIDLVKYNPVVEKLFYF